MYQQALSIHSLVRYSLLPPDGHSKPCPQILKSPTPPHFPDGLNPHLIERIGAFRRKLLNLPSTTIRNLTESVPIFSLFPPNGGGRVLHDQRHSLLWAPKPSPLALPRTWLLCSLLLLSLFPPSSVTHSHRHNNTL